MLSNHAINDSKNNMRLCPQNKTLLTWTTYPDLNLKSDCCFLPLTSTTPSTSREVFLPDKMSSNLNNEMIGRINITT